jgi:hypothetical protein
MAGQKVQLQFIVEETKAQKHCVACLRSQLVTGSQDLSPHLLTLIQVTQTL